MVLAAAPAAAPIAAPLPQPAAAPMAAPSPVVPAIAAASRPTDVGPSRTSNCDWIGTIWPSTRVRLVSVKPRRETPDTLPAFFASTTWPATVWPYRATTMPSTITGCVSAAEKTPPTRLWPEESGSLMRTVKIVPGFMVNGGDTICASCPNTTLATNSKVAANVVLRRAKIVVRSIAPSDQPEILVQERCKGFYITVMGCEDRFAPLGAAGRGADL